MEESWLRDGGSPAGDPGKAGKAARASVQAQCYPLAYCLSSA